MGRSDDLRCFVAVEVGAAVRRRLAREIGFLQLAGAPVRWTSPDNLHLTVRFIGNVRPDEVIGITDVVEEACDEVVPCKALVRGVHTFPPGKSRPSVVAVGIEGEIEPLHDLFARLQVGLAELGFKPEHRGWKPHVTLGRIRGRRDWGDLLERIEQGRAREFGNLEVNAAHLMMSDITAEGAVYTSMKKFDI